MRFLKALMVLFVCTVVWVIPGVLAREMGWLGMEHFCWKAFLLALGVTASVSLVGICVLALQVAFER